MLGDWRGEYDANAYVIHILTVPGLYRNLKGGIGQLKGLCKCSGDDLGALV